MHETNIQDYYTTHGLMTDPRRHAHLFADLPDDVPGLVKTIQGLQVHIFWANAYQLKLTPERESEVTIRPVWRKLARLLELDPAPLNLARPAEHRLVGNCRDFTVFTVAMLRSQGIPARSRCGFGTYFIPGHYEDHWVFEYWHGAEQRWVMADAQMDSLQQKALNLSFDALDMPPGAFVTGGEAWLMARHGEADPECFGIFEYKGIDFIKGNLIRDLAALNKFEALPWDMWGWVEHPSAEMSADELALLDHAARICHQADIPAALALYKQSPQFQPPPDWAE
jgi:hypothetical protein